MLSDWEKFAGWKVLEFFLHNPTAEIHVRALARELKVSPLTANTYLKNYFKDGLLSETKRGNALFYRLKDSPLAKSLKKCFILSLLSKKGFVNQLLVDNPSTTSIILYGSMASGEYDEKSDFDVLVFSKDGKFPSKAVKLLGKEANVKVLTLSELKKLDSSFRASVGKNHVVLYGSGLVA